MSKTKPWHWFPLTPFKRFGDALGYGVAPSVDLAFSLLSHFEYYPWEEGYVTHKYPNLFLLKQIFIPLVLLYELISAILFLLIALPLRLVANIVNTIRGKLTFWEMCDFTALDLAYSVSGIFWNGFWGNPLCIIMVAPWMWILLVARGIQYIWQEYFSRHYALERQEHALEGAVRNKKIRVLQQLLEGKNISHSDKKRAFNLACAYGNVEVVRWLLKSYKDYNKDLLTEALTWTFGYVRSLYDWKQVDKPGSSDEQFEIIKMLLDKGAKPAIHRSYIANSMNLKILKLFVEKGLALNAVNEQNDTVLQAIIHDCTFGFYLNHEREQRQNSSDNLIYCLSEGANPYINDLSTRVFFIRDEGMGPSS